ncbi:MAG TPA: chlororespiratory reduction protein 7 [Leptolyngbyaceae cyanobacterium M33_DOE_097]|uniref:Chlororespiratory reduction protein 7 n=1 Tax=Oscillatoriales cyanobacterium SpSt-418 TaxID=2282169 RepID=A0A7C3KEX0_9CYAN|nr:chlororespiratory reduction protein 7 [Leptolyngbyaceae cyanobacterium M33_DOE_097]
MPDPRLYESEHYVVLEPDQPEQFFTRDELRAKLESILNPRQDDLPRELQRIAAVTDQANYLIDNSCELDLAPGESMQWYVVRLEKK